MITTTQVLEIASGLISQYFPELKGKRLDFAFVSGKDYYMAAAKGIFCHRIYIDSVVLAFSVKAFKGCLAHEFAHVVALSKVSYIKAYMQPQDQKSIAMEERAADTLVIERGLGPELLQFHREHKVDHVPYLSNEGLTTKEIKKMLKKMSTNTHNI